jgi:hypothetical protein
MILSKLYEYTRSDKCRVYSQFPVVSDRQISTGGPAPASLHFCGIVHYVQLACACLVWESLFFPVYAHCWSAGSQRETWSLLQSVKIFGMAESIAVEGHHPLVVSGVHKRLLLDALTLAAMPMIMPNHPFSFFLHFTAQTGFACIFCEW